MTVDRRTVLRLAGLSAGAGVVTAATLPGTAANAADAVFAHGVASGDPVPGGILLWTRVSGFDAQVSVEWQIAADASFAVLVQSGAVPTGPDRDHTVKVDVGGLAPATTYWYRFGVAGAWSPTGRTMTAPAADDAITRLRLGVVSCANWEAGYFAAYRHLAERGDLNLVVHLGDYLYEYGTGDFAARGVVVRATKPDHEILTLADYRTRHAQYKTDPDLQRLHASVPWIITWDDHEVANDMWSDGAENHTPGTEGDFAARKAAARQAYAEWMPVRLGADGHIYRRLRYGNLVELSMLDLRSYRSQQAGGVVVDDPDRTIGRRSAGLADRGPCRVDRGLETGRQPGDHQPARSGHPAGLAARPAGQAARHPEQRHRGQRRPVGRLQRRPGTTGRSAARCPYQGCGLLDR